MSEQVTITVALTPTKFCAWEAAMLEELAAIEQIALCLVSIDRPQQQEPGAYALFETLENRIFGLFDDPMAHSNLPASLQQLTCASIPQDTDLIVVLGALRDQRQNYLESSRLGVLWYDTVDDAGVSLQPAGYHEVMASKKSSNVVVRLSTTRFDGRIVYHSSSSTDSISPRRNRERMFWKAKSFLPRLIRHTIASGTSENEIELPLITIRHPAEDCTAPQWPMMPEPSTDGSASATLPIDHEAREISYGYPAATQLCKQVLFKIPDIIRFYYHAKLTLEQWYLLFQFTDNANTDLKKFTTIMPPADRMWADPHILKKDGVYHVFIEEMLFSENKGFISVLQIDEAGHHSQPIKVLERDYHLSYPQVFEWEGEIYMLPESSANHTVELYRCMSFPDQWEQVDILLDNVIAVDSSLLHKDGKWWLFCSIKQHPAASENDELHIFHATELVGGKWQPHRENPVISDVSQARPAGRIYAEAGQLIRPSQNCSGIYGFGFNLNNMIELNETRYCEEIRDEVTADQYPEMIATHTWAREKRLTVVDACRRISTLTAGRKTITTQLGVCRT